MVREGNGEDWKVGRLGMLEMRDLPTAFSDSSGAKLGGLSLFPLFQRSSILFFNRPSVLHILVCLTALLSLCAFATACGRRSHPPTSDTPPSTSDLRPPPTPPSAVVPTSHITPPSALPTSALLPSAPTAIASTTPIHPIVHLPQSIPHLSPAPSTARQISSLVRSADDAVRASLAGSQAWARVLQARAAYADVLNLDGEYRELVARLARIEDIAATNAPGDAEAVGTALAQREQTLLRDLPEAARARAVCGQAESYYGSLVQADARYVESVGLIKAMGTNEAQAKAP